jgi:hypothetical protein|tara:strand:- start:180 stop:419 length:240 start_codon:yes stop_codon:yes gene_type:complete
MVTRDLVTCQGENMLTQNFNGTVVVKNSESGALAQAILTAKTEEELKVNLNGVPLTFERLNKNRYIATCSSLSFELVTG